MADSGMYVEEGELWLRIAPGHAVSGSWLREYAPELLAQWWDADAPERRDRITVRIARRLDQIEGPSEPPSVGGTDARRGSWPLGRGDAGAALSDRWPRVLAEMTDASPRAAMRFEVLAAVVSAGTDARALRLRWAGHGADLSDVPALLPASDFYHRHRAAIDAQLDVEIAGGGHADLPRYMATWPRVRPGCASLHDLEIAVVEHVVAGVVETADGDRLHELRVLRTLFEQAYDRLQVREWTEAATATRSATSAW